MNDYEDLTIDELEGLLLNPQDIETGCEQNCASCLNEEMRKIKDALRIAKDKDEGSFYNP
jgi:hypothetical protein